jgi:hypothetical protein
MKLSKKIVQILCILLACTSIISCKKDKGKEDNKPSSCRIIAATIADGSATTTVNISYNNDKKISSVSMSGAIVSNKVFSYNGNTIIGNATTAGGAFSGRDSVTLDNMGRPVNIRQIYNQSGTSWHNVVYEYSGDIMTKISEAYQGNTYPVSYTVNSVDGNVVSFGNSGTSTSLEYYTDKSIQPGDYLEFPTWIYYGVSIYPRKNLIKKLNSGGGNFEEVSYEFDADGKITKAIVNYGSGVNTYTYQYQCD